MKLKLAAVALMIGATMCCSQTTEGFELLDRMLGRGGCGGYASTCCDTPASACGGRTFGISLSVTLPGRLFGGGHGCGFGGGCYDGCGFDQGCGYNTGCDTGCGFGGFGGGLLSGGCGGGGLLSGGYGHTGGDCGCYNNCMPVCNDSCGGGLLSSGFFSGWGCRGFNNGCNTGCGGYDGGCGGCGDNHFDHGCGGCYDSGCGCGGKLLNGNIRGRLSGITSRVRGINVRGRLCNILCNDNCGGGCYQSCNTGCNNDCGYQHQDHGCYDSGCNTGCGGGFNLRGRIGCFSPLSRIRGGFSCNSGCNNGCGDYGYGNSGCGCNDGYAYGAGHAEGGAVMQQPVMDAAQPMNMNQPMLAPVGEPTPAGAAPAVEAVDPNAGAHNWTTPVVNPSSFIIRNGRGN
ncbi:MAG: hypothetical protein AAF456_15730 [Planctomycetota bacterium]